MDQINLSTNNSQLDEDTLVFRRQYFMSRTTVNLFPHWSCTTIASNSFVYTHPDVDITTIRNGDATICVIGYCFSPLEDNTDNASTVASLVGTSDTSAALIQSFLKACGRYVIIIKTNKEFCAFTDALSLKPLYFSRDQNSTVTLASDINLFKYISSLTLNNDLDLNKDAFNFYNHEFKENGDGNAWIGDETIYKNISKLLPNSIFNIQELNIKRYWPRNRMENNSTKYVADKASKYIRAVLEHAKSRQSLSIAITAGYDSRIMVAATHPFKDSIRYFIDKHEYMDHSHPDIVISQTIAKALELDFTVNSQKLDNSNIPPIFKKIYYNNTFYAGDKRLSTVYFYFNEYSQYLNVCGVGEVGRTRFGPNRFPLTPARLAYKYGYINSAYATKISTQWYKGVKNICKEMHINPFTLFYWENDLGNWGSVGNCESDIAIEEFNPFNSHYLLELLLSAPASDSECSENKVFDLIIETLCPQITDIPINPSFTLSGKIKKELKKEPLYTTLDYIRYIYKTNLERLKTFLRANT